MSKLKELEKFILNLDILTMSAYSKEQIINECLHILGSRKEWDVRETFWQKSHKVLRSIYDKHNEGWREDGAFDKLTENLPARIDTLQAHSDLLVKVAKAYEAWDLGEVKKLLGENGMLGDTWIENMKEYWEIRKSQKARSDMLVKVVEDSEDIVKLLMSFYASDNLAIEVFKQTLTEAQALLTDEEKADVE